jgi:hypothetical protein
MKKILILLFLLSPLLSQTSLDKKIDGMAKIVWKYLTQRL